MNIAKPGFLFAVLSIAAAAVAAAEPQVLAVDHNGASKLWSRTDDSAPPYPSRAANNEVQGCLAIGFLIDEHGKTSGLRVLRSKLTGGGPETQEQLQNAALTWVNERRFEPTPANAEHRAIYTYLPLAFSVKRMSSYISEQQAIRSMERKKMDEPCEIADFSAEMSRLTAPAADK